MTAYTDNFIHALTYWAPGENDGFGRTSFAAPVELTGRWQDKAVLFRDAQAREVVSEAVVYVSQALTNGGYLYKGLSASLAPISGAKEVRQAQQSPALDDSRTLYKVML